MNTTNQNKIEGLTCAEAICDSLFVPSESAQYYEQVDKIIARFFPAPAEEEKQPTLISNGPVSCSGSSGGSQYPVRFGIHITPAYIESVRQASREGKVIERTFNGLEKANWHLAIMPGDELKDDSWNNCTYRVKETPEKEDELARRMTTIEIAKHCPICGAYKGKMHSSGIYVPGCQHEGGQQAKPNPPTLALEDGKTYLNRRGEKVLVFSDPEPDDFYKFMDIGYNYYSANGCFYNFQEDSSDLISLVEETGEETEQTRLAVAILNESSAACKDADADLRFGEINELACKLLRALRKQRKEGDAEMDSPKHPNYGDRTAPLNSPEESSTLTPGKDESVGVGNCAKCGNNGTVFLATNAHEREVLICKECLFRNESLPKYPPSQSYFCRVPDEETSRKIQLKAFECAVTNWRGEKKLLNLNLGQIHLSEGNSFTTFAASGWTPTFNATELSIPDFMDLLESRKLVEKKQPSFFDSADGMSIAKVDWSGLKVTTHGFPAFYTHDQAIAIGEAASAFLKGDK